MWPRMPWRSYYVFAVICIALFGYFSIQRKENRGDMPELAVMKSEEMMDMSRKSKETRDESMKDKSMKDKSMKSGKVGEKPKYPQPMLKPYTVPDEMDYEQLNEVLPHMWKNAIDINAPIRCDLITFDYNPNMNLGEAMFIYAALYGVARRTNRIPFIDYRVGFPLVQIFHLNWMPTSGALIDFSFMKLHETGGCCRYDDSYFNASCYRKVILSGYRQSYRYFDEYRRELLSTEFVFKEDIGTTCVGQFETLLARYEISNVCQLVAVHIRHKDELTDRQREQGHVGADQAYLDRAFDYFLQKYSDSCLAFIVAGNEGAKIKEITPKNREAKIVFAEESSEALQLCVLTMCHHAIITTGPVGWWTAHITQLRSHGEVLYQSKFAAEGSELEKQLDEDSYFPDSWTGK